MGKAIQAVIVVIIVAAAGYFGWQFWEKRQSIEPAVGIASASGRLEAVEIALSSRTTGRLSDLLVDEGDIIAQGATVARFDTAPWNAEKREAEAQQARAKVGVETAKSLVSQRTAEQDAAVAAVAVSEIERESAERRLARSELQYTKGAVSDQVMDDDRARVQGSLATIAAGKARIAAAAAAVGAAKAQVLDAEAAIAASQATLERIDADIADATLTAPRNGRVQSRTAQPGEVVIAGGPVARMIDLDSVFITFFLPTRPAEGASVGDEVRVTLDAAPQYVIAAKISFVADVAELVADGPAGSADRGKLMFRMRAQIPPELLQKSLVQIRTGLQGRVSVKLDPKAEWPSALSQNLLK